MHGIFFEISLVIVLAGVMGMLMHLLKQPAIIGYVLTGLIIGPLGYMHLNSTEILNSLSEIGITLLLFMVGLELSLKDIKRIGPVVAIVGAVQIGIMLLLGTSILTLVGFPLRAALYLALGLSISSTIIAVKILSEKKDLDSLHGKLVLGVLIVEDIVSIVALALITGFGTEKTAEFSALIFVLGKLLILFAIAIVASTKLFPWIVEKLSRSSELIFLFSLAWGLGFATLISEGLFGLKPEIGGFLAGLTLANSAQHLHIASRMKPLRDFFLILFFIVLGSRLVINDFGNMLLVALGLVILGVLVKPLFTFITLSILGYRGRTSFLTATSLAHVSEFSIILAVLGWQAGHLSEEILSLMTLTTILSFLAATYLMYHNDTLARRFSPWLQLWDSSHIKEMKAPRPLSGHIVLIGGHRTGQSILHSLEELHKKFIVVDFNPAIVHTLKEKGIQTVFGDMSDPEIIDHVNLEKAKAVISTVPDLEDNLALLESLRTSESKAKTVLSASSDWEAKKLYEKGADYVLMPHFLSGLQLAEILKKDVNLRTVHKLRERDLELISQIG